MSDTWLTRYKIDHPVPEGDAWLLVGGQKLMQVHDKNVCVNQICLIHNPSPHPMRAMLQEWVKVGHDSDSPEERSGRTSCICRLCDHGWWHPDPDGISDTVCPCTCRCCEFNQQKLTP